MSSEIIALLLSVMQAEIAPDIATGGNRDIPSGFPPNIYPVFPQRITSAIPTRIF